MSKPGKLLVSYNTFTFDFWKDIQKDASIYHPRFVWVNYRWISLPTSMPYRPPY